MNELHVFLVTAWFVLLGLIIALYVVLDGFDLGIGMLSLLERETDLRTQMLLPISGVWDANETWLVLAGGVLFGAFPLAYALVLSQLYIPVMLLLFGLILRGVGLEYSHHAPQPCWWLRLFGIGSLLASVAQGLVLGGILNGLPVTGTSGSGFIFNWLTPFTLLVTVGVVLGYAMLGATFLLWRSTGVLHEQAQRWASRTALGMLAVLVAVAVWTPNLHPQMAQRWAEPPTLMVMVGILLSGLVASCGLFLSLRDREYGKPFLWGLLVFALAFAGLAVSLFPDFVPGRFSLQQAAASNQTLLFMIVGIGVLMPVMLAYNGFQYLVFSKHMDVPHAP
ncbi:MAG: cytochrome d ubiquinol oxidase subunit II [Thiothrix lacustris]|uniref:Cytochrome d ubiquinol oxidase subunit II n=1 Tax=Thiothrix lacustris TaxID=525917 RepID=A0A1Y1QUG7_9GAMM|nr:MAG: cytochrome d ubiquinol oxidase subunit II [Thiothrix lacustris]